MSAIPVPRRGHATAALTGGLTLFLRRLRLEPLSALTMFLLVAGTCFLFAALPRLFNAFADDGLRFAVRHASPVARQVRVTDVARVAPGRTGTHVSATAQALPASLRKLIEPQGFVVGSPVYILEQDRRPTGIRQGIFRYVSLRFQPGANAHVRLVSGRFPGTGGGRTTAPVAQVVLGNRSLPNVPGLAKTKDVPVVEVAMSTQTARIMRLKLGQLAIFTPELNDLAVQQVPIRDQLPLAIRITGIFAVKKPSDPFWFGDDGLEQPAVQQSQSLDEQNVFAQALVSEDGYARMLAAARFMPMNYDSRYAVQADRLDARAVGTLRADLAQLESQFAGAKPMERHVQVALSPVLGRYTRQRSQAETLLGVAAIGLFACALACLGLLAALSHERRRSETGLSRTRGASPHHLLGAQAAEGLLIAVPAGFVGWAVAQLVVDGRGSSLSVWFVVVVVLATALLPVAAIVGIARRPLGAAERDEVVARGPSPRRLAVEALVVAAAGLGVYLLRRRGLGDAGGGFDPYLAGVPVLLGLACGIVALRLYPLPVALFARLARRGRGLPLHLGLSRAARQPDATSLPLIVLVLALAIATFAAAMSSTLDNGQQRSSWRAIGADLRVDALAGDALPPALIARLSKLGTAAPAYAQEAGVGPQGGVLLAVDPQEYERVVAGTPAAIRLPKSLGNLPPIPQLVPAVVSAGQPGGGTFPGSDGQTITLLATGTRNDFPGVPHGTPFAVVSLPTVRKAHGIIHPNRVYLAGADAGDVARAVRQLAPDAEVASRTAVVRALGAPPLASSVRRGFRAAVVLAAVFAAVALALMALIAARSRARDLALVRTMGGSQRQGTLLAAVELAPFVATALALGIGLGIAIPYLVDPGLNLAFYTGSRTNPISIPWLPPVVFAAGVVALAVLAVLVAGVRMRRARLDQVLRIGER